MTRPEWILMREEKSNHNIVCLKSSPVTNSTVIKEENKAPTPQNTNEQMSAFGWIMWKEGTCEAWAECSSGWGCVVNVWSCHRGTTTRRRMQRGVQVALASRRGGERSSALWSLWKSPRRRRGEVSPWLTAANQWGLRKQKCPRDIMNACEF